MKKLILLCCLGVSLLFGSVDLQSISKNKLVSIKGIGAKKAELILDYRKENTISSIDDLKKIKGLGKKSIQNIKDYIDSQNNK